MDSNMTSARTSLISSVDSCYTNDSSNFAHFLAAAAAAESLSGASLSGEHGKNLLPSLKLQLEAAYSDLMGNLMVNQD